MGKEASVEITLKMTYTLPVDPAERTRLYETDDIAACVQVDMDNDPMMVISESETEVLAVKWSC